jgi:hypothetical protein
LELREEELVFCPLLEVGEENDFNKLDMTARAIAMIIKVTSASSAARIIALLR